MDQLARLGRLASEPPSKLVAAPRAVIYATFRRKILSSHSCIEIRFQAICLSERMPEAFPANERPDNSQSGMIPKMTESLVQLCEPSQSHGIRTHRALKAECGHCKREVAWSWKPPTKTHATDAMRDAQISEQNYQVVSLRLTNTGYLEEVRRLVEQFDALMKQADDNVWSVRRGRGRSYREDSEDSDLPF